MRTDVMIEIVVIVEKSSGTSKVIYLCDIAPADESMDIYVAELSKSIALYHHDSYDDARRALRAQRRMTYPGGDGERLILVGQVRRTFAFDPVTHLELSRAQLRLKAIPLDEW